MVIQENNAIRIGIVGSLTVHLLLFLSVGLWMSMAPARSALPLQTREELEQETTLIFPDDLPPEVAAEPKPEPEPKVTPPPVPQDSQKYVRTTQNADVPEAPANAPFVSDRNTVASSRLLPEKGGDANLPTTRGVDIPTMELTNRDYKDGEIKNDAAGAPPAPSAPTVAPLTLVPPTPPAPRTPATPPRPAPAAPVVAVPDIPTLKPVEPAPLPPPSSVMPTPLVPELPDLASKVESRSEQMVRELEEQLRKSDAVDTPPKSPRTPTTALEMRSPMEGSQAPAIPQPPLPEGDTPPSLSPLVPQMSKAEMAAFSPQTSASDTKGGVNNIGAEDAVAAAATPVGRYMRQVTSAVEKKWHFYRNREADAVEPGRLSVKFYVNKFGKVEDLKFTMKDANPLMEDFTIEAILKAEIPPIPADLVPVLDKERLEINYDIVIHP